MRILDRLYVDKNDIVVMVDGGLGSQINKYLVAQYVKNKYPDARVSYDISWFQQFGMSIDGKDTRNFDLLRTFDNLDFPIAHRRACRYLRRKRCCYNKEAFVKHSFDFQIPVYIDGYYEHWEYFANLDLTKIKFNQALVRNNALHVARIRGLGQSVAVHIRRGDYVGSIHDVLGASYYLEAIKIVQTTFPEACFVLFSTGMDWVRENILPYLKNTNVLLLEEYDNSHGMNDFYLISQCKHQIISNSTFSYFATLFNQHQEKIVVAPKQWMAQDAGFEGHDDAMSFPEWITI